MKNILSALTILLYVANQAQELKILNQEKSDISFRGLSVIDGSVFWVSGSKGTIGYTVNGGKSFTWVNPKGYENRDFRDIEALDYKTVIAIAIDEPGIILRTNDSGKTWKKVYQDDTKGVFLDAIDFSINDPNKGILVGDPIDGYPYIAKTENAGNQWELLSLEERKNQFGSLQKDEAFFAASGSNVKILKDSLIMMVTGGSASKFILNSKPEIRQKLPQNISTQTSGANGLDYSELEKYGLIVGGDFSNPDSDENNLMIFELNSLQKFKLISPEISPKGYKSGVAILGNGKAVACGISGIDITQDKGKTWTHISDESYHVCERSRIGNHLFLAGADGKISKLIVN